VCCSLTHTRDQQKPPYARHRFSQILGTYFRVLSEYSVHYQRISILTCVFQLCRNRVRGSSEPRTAKGVYWLGGYFAGANTDDEDLYILAYILIFFDFARTTTCGYVQIYQVPRQLTEWAHVSFMKIFASKGTQASTQAAKRSPALIGHHFSRPVEHGLCRSLFTTPFAGFRGATVTVYTSLTPPPARFPALVPTPKPNPRLGRAPPPKGCRTAGEG
jgi:hypothetical protein